MSMTIAEAIDIIEETCPCTDPLCPDARYYGQLQEARQVLRDLNADDEAERRLEDAYAEGPPPGWEP